MRTTDMTTTSLQGGYDALLAEADREYSLRIDPETPVKITEASVLLAESQAILGEMAVNPQDFTEPDTNPTLVSNAKDRWDKIGPSVLRALEGLRQSVVGDEAQDILKKFDFRVMECSDTGMKSTKKKSRKTESAPTLVNGHVTSVENVLAEADEVLNGDVNRTPLRGLESQSRNESELNPKQCIKCGSTATESKRGSGIIQCKSCGNVYEARPNPAPGWSPKESAGQNAHESFDSTKGIGQSDVIEELISKYQETGLAVVQESDWPEMNRRGYMDGEQQRRDLQCPSCNNGQLFYDTQISGACCGACGEQFYHPEMIAKVKGVKRSWMQPSESVQYERVIFPVTEAKPMTWSDLGYHPFMQHTGSVQQTWPPEHQVQGTYHPESHRVGTGVVTHIEPGHVMVRWPNGDESPAFPHQFASGEYHLFRRQVPQAFKGDRGQYSGMDFGEALIREADGILNPTSTSIGRKLVPGVKRQASSILRKSQPQPTSQALKTASESRGAKCGSCGKHEAHRDVEWIDPETGFCDKCITPLMHDYHWQGMHKDQPDERCSMCDGAVHERLRSHNESITKSCWGCGNDWTHRWSSNDLARMKPSSMFSGAHLCPDCIEAVHPSESDFGPSQGPKHGNKPFPVHLLYATHHACNNCGWSGKRSDATYCPNCKFGKLHVVDRTGKEVQESKNGEFMSPGADMYPDSDAMRAHRREFGTPQRDGSYRKDDATKPPKSKKSESISDGYLPPHVPSNNQTRPDGQHTETGPEVPHASLELQDLHRRLGSALPELHQLVTSTITAERTALSMLFNELNTAHSDIGNILSYTGTIPDTQMNELASHYSMVVNEMLGALSVYHAKNPSVGLGPYQFGGTLNDSVSESSNYRPGAPRQPKPFEPTPEHRAVYDVMSSNGPDVPIENLGRVVGTLKRRGVDILQAHKSGKLYGHLKAMWMFGPKSDNLRGEGDKYW